DTQARLRASRSGSGSRRGRTVDASAIASGGTMPAAITAAMIRSDAGSATLRAAVAKAYDALFNGPPRPKHIIRPSTMPRMMTDVPLIPLSQFVRPEVIAASGRPRSENINRQQTTDD